MTRDAAARSSRGTTHGPRRILFGCCRSPDEIPALIAHQCATAKRCALKNRQERECDPAITPTLCEKSGLGALIEVPTIGGPVAVTVPKGSNTGTTLRLRDRGIRNRKSGQRGHQMIDLKVVLPVAEELELVAFLETWQPKTQKDPRKEMLP